MTLLASPEGTSRGPEPSVEMGVEMGEGVLDAQMLANGGQLNGRRILSPWTVDTMLSNNVGDLFNGQIGRPPKGVGFGLGGEVVVKIGRAHV
jgi:hypothetical protein